MDLILRRLQAVILALSPHSGSRGGPVKINSQGLRSLKAFWS